MFYFPTTEYTIDYKCQCGTVNIITTIIPSNSILELLDPIDSHDIKCGNCPRKVVFPKGSGMDLN